MRRWMWLLISGVCLAGLALASFPAPDNLTTYQTRPPAWTLRLSQPAFLRSGETGRFSVLMRPPQGLSASIQSVTMRLELENLVNGSTEAGEAIQPGGSASFSWVLQSDMPGRFTGRLWVYAGDPPALLNTRPVEIEVRGPPLGPLWLLRIALAVGCCAVAWLARRVKK